MFFPHFSSSVVNIFHFHKETKKSKFLAVANSLYAWWYIIAAIELAQESGRACFHGNPTLSFVVIDSLDVHSNVNGVSCRKGHTLTVGSLKAMLGPNIK